MQKVLFCLLLPFSILGGRLTSISVLESPSYQGLFLLGGNHLDDSVRENTNLTQLDNLSKALKENDERGYRTLILLEQPKEDVLAVHRTDPFHSLMREVSDLKLKHTVIEDCDTRSISSGFGRIFSSFRGFDCIKCLKYQLDSPELKEGLDATWAKYYKCYLDDLRFETLAKAFELHCMQARTWRDHWQDEKIHHEFDASLADSQREFKQLMSLMQDMGITLDMKPLDYALSILNTDKEKKAKLLVNRMEGAFKRFLDLYVYQRILLLQDGKQFDKIIVVTGRAHECNLNYHLKQTPGYHEIHSSPYKPIKGESTYNVPIDETYFSYLAKSLARTKIELLNPCSIM